MSAGKRYVLDANVFTDFGVDYCNTFEMLRDFKEQFVLRTRQWRR